MIRADVRTGVRVPTAKQPELCAINKKEFEEMKSLKKFLVLSSVVLSVSAPAFALDSFIPSAVSALGTGAKDLLKTTAIGSDHRAYMPASALGIVGFDIGVDVTAIKVSNEFEAAMSAITGSPVSLAVIPVPRLSVHKGLPFGVDLGFSYFKLQDKASLWGGEAKWAFLNGGLVLPSIAARVSYSSSKLWFLETSTFKFDVVASKNFMVFEPYGGLGIQSWSGDLKLDAIQAAVASAAGVSTHASGTSPHIYGGLAMKLLLLRITGEVDYNTSGVTTYGLKASLGF